MAHQFPRIAVFIDGFNLYFGLKQSCLERYLWLDLRLLSEKFLQPEQSIASINYFTACVTSPEDKKKRQQDYLEALVAHSGVNIVRGRFLETIFQCRDCGGTHKKREEKKTDVAIATALMLGAVRDDYDAAILISGDSDLVPPVMAVRSQWPDKRVFVKFPPKRVSAELKECCHGAGYINDKLLRVCQLPNEVRKPCGYVLRRPKSWR